MRQRAHQSLPPLLCAIALVGCVRSEPITQTLAWKGPMTADTWMRLRNVSGDFTVTEGTGDSAEVRLEVTRSNRYAPVVQLKVLTISDGLLACVLTGENNKCSVDEYEGGNTYKRGFLPFMKGSSSVTGTITLPRGMKFDYDGTNGDLTIDGLSRELRATTVNGDIDVSGSRGSIDVTTTNGDLDLSADSIGSAVTVRTTNGDISIDFPAALEATVSMRTTNGDLNLQSAATITRKTAKELVAMLGRGGVPVNITTTNGDVTMRQRGTPEK